MTRPSLTTRGQQVNEIDDPASRRVRRLSAGSSLVRICTEIRTRQTFGIFWQTSGQTRQTSGIFGHNSGDFPMPVSIRDSEHKQNKATTTGTYADQKADANMDANKGWKK